MGALQLYLTNSSPQLVLFLQTNRLLSPTKSNHSRTSHFFVQSPIIQEATKYQLHPVLLDASFQALAAALDGTEAVQVL